MHVENHKGFISAPLFMAALWLVPALSQEQGATAGYVSAVKFDLLRVYLSVLNDDPARHPFMAVPLSSLSLWTPWFLELPCLHQADPEQ